MIKLCADRSTGLWLALIASMLGALASVSHAQLPIGPELRVSQPSESSKFNPRVLIGPDGRVAVSWSGARLPPQPCPECSSIWGAFWHVYSASGELLSEQQLEGMGVDAFDPPALTSTRSGELSVLVEENERDEPARLWETVQAWSTGQVLQRRALLTTIPPVYPVVGDAVRSPDGTLFVAGFGRDLPIVDGCDRCDYGVFAQVFGEDGSIVSDVFRVHDDPNGSQLARGVAADGSGRFLVTWWSNPAGDRSGDDVMVRRFTGSGIPEGPAIRANSRVEGDQDPGGVAAAADGGFAVVWDDFFDDGTFGDVWLQRFSPTAEKVGPAIHVNAESSSQYNSRVAMDRAGNFVVVWQSFDAVGVDFWDIKGQLFRKDGRRVGPEFVVNTYRLNSQEDPYVAFGDNGTFGVVWKSFFQPPGSEDWDIYLQRFSASPGDEPCWVRGVTVFCDTGRTGGAPEIEMSFGGRPGETLLAGDFDGDGRADLCARYGTRFRCDLDHRGAPAERALDSGLPGDVPLMGDIDGDGKAEVCVRRKRQLLCDTGHDGGKPEVRIVFGSATDTPLLGDLNGDGKDDPCVYRSGRFYCDTAHDGGGAEVEIGFGKPGDLPLMGDLDGDGRDDPCVLRSGHLLCDTAHDGGAPEVDLALDAQAGDLPLLANLDGL